MVKIRLMRMGKRKEPYYRVVVADSRSPRDGRFIENIGRYHPRAHPSVIEIDEERALHWLRDGAQPSDPVRVLLQKTGIWSSFTGEPPPPPFDPGERPASASEPSDSPSSTEGVSSGEPSGSPDEATDEPPESTDEAEGSAEGTSPVPEAESEASASGDPEGSTSDAPTEESS
jgi:small subunit ribosomal protein S16